MLNTGLNLLNKVESLGNYSALIVGGAPRDIIIGRPISDIDIALTTVILSTLSRFTKDSFGAFL